MFSINLNSNNHSQIQSLSHASLQTQLKLKNSPLVHVFIAVLYFYKWTVLKVLCYQNIYAEKHGRNLHVHIFIGDNHGE